MSPSREINDKRPSPLKIPKDSTVIKNGSSSSSSSSSTPSSTSQRQPVIIYTHSPKVIHAKPCDFMAIVQKLTGFSGSSNNDGNNSPTLPSPNNDNSTPPASKKRKTSLGKKKINEELTKPKPSLDDTTQMIMPSQLPSVTTNLELKPLLSDVPLFTQGFSSEFFDLPDSICKCAQPPGISPTSTNINNSSSNFSDI